MNEEQDIQRSERIHAYLHGMMDVHERAQFEQEMAGDPDLRSEVGAAHVLDAALGQEQELRFRKLVGTVSDRAGIGGGGELDDETPVIPIGRRNNLRWMAAAASVAILAGAAAWFFITGQRTNDTAQFAWVDIGVSHPRSGGQWDFADSLHLSLTTRFDAARTSKQADRTLEEKLEAALEIPAYAARYGDDGTLMHARLRIARAEYGGALDLLFAGPLHDRYRCAFLYYRAVALVGSGKLEEGRELIHTQGCDLGNAAKGLYPDS